jgi:NADPH2:quinone reductase
MKAVICRQYGPIAGLEYVDVPDPVPGPKEAVIETEAAGVNFPDGLLVQGQYQMKPPTPFTPGMETVGRVVAVGGEVTRCRVGDRVAALSMLGGYAERVKAHQNAVTAVGPDADAGETAALLCGYGTALYALKQRAALKPGEWLAVTGAAGLTGLAAVEIGKAMGARVVAIASSGEKRRLALAHGADKAIGYDNLKDAIREATGGEGADVCFEVVGGDVFDACARAMNWGGRLLVIGFAGGQIPKFPVNLALVKNFSVVGVFWGAFTQREPKAQAENFAQLLTWRAEGKVKPAVESVYPLAKAAEALQLIHDRKAAGKVILKP